MKWPPLFLAWIWAAVLFGPAAPSLAEVFGAPVSDEVIEGDLYLKGKAKPFVHFEVREGSMVTVRNTQDGSWYGITPVLSEKRELLFAGFRITDLGNGGQGVVQLVKDVQGDSNEAFSAISMGSSTPVHIFGSPLAITVQSVRAKKFIVKAGISPLRASSPHQLQKIFGASGGGLCSVTCGELSVTAAIVTMNCGRCESGSYSSIER
jgi:hypothetical protein